MQPEMTSLQRVLTTLQYKEPDRVPIFLCLSTYGAKELGVSIKQYFSHPESVVEAQLRMRAKYGNDCVYCFFYASIETEAWGGEVIFSECGPPNSGTPFIGDAEDILGIEPPRVRESVCLRRPLKAIEMLNAAVGGETAIVGVVMSPFSVPVMQIGFDKYIELIYERPDLFERLMKMNREFCVEWANAQLGAGATAIVYFDPVSSPTIVPRELFLRTGYEVAKQTIAGIQGPVAVHLASARSQPIVEDLVHTGAAIVGASNLDNLAEVKASCAGKIAVLGNLNGIEMRHWTPEQAESMVKDAIAKAGPGGGFILSDGHGDIPWQVPEDVLLSISEANRKWGRYPLDWV